MQLKAAASPARPVSLAKTPWLFTALLGGFLVSTTVAQALESQQILYAGWACIGMMGVLASARVLRQGLRLPPELALYWLFVVWSVGIGSVVAVDLGTFQQIAERVLQVGILISIVAYYTALFRTPSPSLLALLALALLLVAYGTVTGNFEIAAEFSQEGKRVSGTRAASLTANANSLGAACVWALGGVALLWGMSRRSVVRLFLVASLPALLAGVMYSASRKAFVLVFVFAAAFLWFCYRRMLLRNLRVFIGVAVAVVAVYFFARIALQDTMLGYRWSGMVSAEEQDVSTRSRLYMYTEGVRILALRPLTGVGLGQFRSYSELGLYSHSEYMEILTNTGPIGAALYFAAYVIAWQRLRRIRRQSLDGSERYAAGVCTALLLTMLVGNLGAVSHASFNTMALWAAIIGFSYGVESRRPLQRRVLRPVGPGTSAIGPGPHRGQGPALEGVAFAPRARH